MRGEFAIDRVARDRGLSGAMAMRFRTLGAVALVVAWHGAALAECPSGRWLLDAGPAVGAITVEGRDVSSDDCGGAVEHVRTAKRAVRIRARWKRCGLLGTVRLTMRIDRTTDAATGTVVERKLRPVHFTARCSACGDGRLDLNGGEECDASASNPGCDGTCVDCACVPATTTSTTTTAPTSSTTTSASSTSTTSTTEPDGPPIVAPEGTWTWVDFPDSTCDEGTPTGIGVNLTSSPNVMILLGFGGFCWDAQTCWVQNTAAHGPYGSADFYAGVPNVTNTILDRALAGSPVADWSFVVVPYCTGDLHAGDNFVVYDTGSATYPTHHAGHANFRAFLRRLGPTFPAAERILVTGIGAGGSGALFNYPDVRARWPAAHVDVVDDSGPLLEGGALDATMLAGWFANWRLDLVTDPLCGLGCRTDPSLAEPALAALHAGDRLALLSHTADPVNEGAFGLDAAAFHAALLAMTADRLDPTSSFRYFLVGNAGYALFAAPASASQNGVMLLPWLGQLLSDDSAWTSVQP
jgi:pectinacetylesterase